MASETKYTAVVARVGVHGNTTFEMGYIPKGVYVYPGDAVRFEDGKNGVALLVDDYLAYDDLMEIEKATGAEFVKINTVYRRNEVNWEEE